MEAYGLPVTFKADSGIHSILWIATRRADYSSLVESLYLERRLVIMIVPGWLDAVWFGKLIRYTTHMWHIGDSVVGCIADFRYSNLDRIAVSDMPTAEECAKALMTVRPLLQIKMEHNGEFRDQVVLPPFDADFLERISEGATHDDLRRLVIGQMRTGFVSGYRGGARYQRDFSAKLAPVEEKRAMDKMIKEVKKGYCLGPFAQCPFPNTWAREQAYISQQFLRPKHKLIAGGEYRLIGNRSFPIGRSFNDLVPRCDATKFIAGYEYFTFRKFLDQLARLGRYTLVSLFDVRDAYKNCRMRADQLWQQIYHVGGMYFIDLGGMFGSRNAGDSWNLVMELIVASIRHNGKLRELNYFVDNGENCTPPVNGKPDMKRARREYEYIIWFLEKAKVPYHEAQGPATKVRFLGWLVDTDAMTVSAPPERMEQIRSMLKFRGAKVSVRVCRSVAGILEFLASVLTFLKAPAGWMQKRAAAMVNGTESCDSGFQERFETYVRYIYSVLNDWNGTTSIRHFSWREKTDWTIYVDASGVHGYGAMVVESKLFTMGKWSTEDLECAFRLKTNSSTFLEVMAICIAIVTFAPKSSCVSIVSDSQSAVYILQKKYCKGSDEIQGRIVATDRWLLECGVNVVYRHVLRQDANIQIVDSLSKGSVGSHMTIHVVGSFTIGGIWLEADRVQKTPLNHLLVSLCLAVHIGKLIISCRYPGSRWLVVRSKMRQTQKGQLRGGRG